MNTLTKTKVGTLLYYIANTFTDGLHRIASSRITRLGRAAHVHLICICQRSDVGSIPGSLKANMEIRITSHCADKESSMTILGVGDAANLPKIPGRFLSSDGVEFQAYNFSCAPGKHL